MLSNLNHLALVLAEFLATSKLVVDGLTLRLVTLGLDPLVVVTRGPSFVIMAFGFSALAHLVRRFNQPTARRVFVFEESSHQVV